MTQCLNNPIRTPPIKTLTYTVDPPVNMHLTLTECQGLRQHSRQQIREQFVGVTGGMDYTKSCGTNMPTATMLLCEA